MSARAAVILVAAWAACTAVGLGVMLHYELTPAPVAAAAAPQWPAQSHLRHESGKPTLVAFFHPHCPCSRASLAELLVLASQCGERVGLRVVFLRPAGSGIEWEQTDLIRTAAGIPGAVVLSDDGGRERDLFGATTSGDILLYGLEGQLLYQGGITASRGHEGDNAGRAALTTLINEGGGQACRSPVFGCPLLTPLRTSQHSDFPCHR